MSNPLLETAFRLHDAGNYDAAARAYADVLRADPVHYDALYRLGLIRFQNAQFAEAERLLAQAIRVRPDAAEALYARGCVLQSLARHEDALAAFARALALKPDFIEVRNNRGVSLLALKRYPEALATFDKLLEQRPNLAIFYGNRAVALHELGRFEDALRSADAALEREPAGGDFFRIRGASLASLSRLNEAVAALDKALAINPRDVEALSRRGIVFADLDRAEESLADFRKALALAPADIELLYNHGHALMMLRRYEEAAADFARVLAASPDFPFARGNLLDCRLRLCDWRGMEEVTSDISQRIAAGRPVIRPLQNVAISQSEADQLQCARIWVARQGEQPTPMWRGERYHHRRIRVAYVSADFREHAVASLAAGVFEHHDRDRFEIFAISLGADDRSAMRARLMRAFDHFFDARETSDAGIAAELRANEIGIAVDLMGFTAGARTGILAHRTAPVQANWLGYPGTMGAPYIDYILSDAIVAPFDSAPHFSERLVHLPGSYLPNDSAREIGRVPTRAEASLPEGALVISAFHPAFKIRPELFDIWMRLLKSVEDSVLWLSPASDDVRRNLAREAEARGVVADRLVFAQGLPTQAAHLARLSLADLYLDTLPYNGHASACDALWAGVPMVTCKGATFAGRVGASLLTALGMPELIAGSLTEYESIALSLLRDSNAIAAAREKLARHRLTAPLFDTAQFTRHLEAAFIRMHDRSEKGLPPEAFAIEPGSGAAR